MEKKTVRLYLRLTPSELETIRQGADKAQMSMSEFTRFLLVNGARGILSEDEQYFSSLLNSTGQVLYARTKGITPAGLMRSEDE